MNSVAACCRSNTNVTAYPVECSYTTMSDAPTATRSSRLSYLLCVLLGLVIGNVTSSSHYRFLSNAILSRFVVGKEEQVRQLHAQENGASKDDASEEIEFTTVMVIVLLLILLTIGFEVMKHGLEKKSNKNTGKFY